MTNNLKKLKKGVIKVFKEIKDKTPGIDLESLTCKLDDTENNNGAEKEYQIRIMQYINWLKDLSSEAHKFCQNLNDNGRKDIVTELRSRILSDIAKGIIHFIEFSEELEKTKEDGQHIKTFNHEFECAIEEHKRDLDSFRSPYSRNQVWETSCVNASNKRTDRASRSDSFWVDQLPTEFLKDGRLSVWIPYSIDRIGQCYKIEERSQIGGSKIKINTKTPYFMYLIQRIINGAKSEGIKEVSIYKTPCPNVYKALNLSTIDEIIKNPEGVYEEILKKFNEKDNAIHGLDLANKEYQFFNNIVCAVDMLYQEEMEGPNIQAGILPWPNIYCLMTEDKFKKFIHIGYYIASSNNEPLAHEFDILGFDISNYIDEIRYDVDKHVGNKKNSTDLDKLISALYLMEEVLVVNLMLNDKNFNSNIDCIALNESGNTCVNKVFNQYSKNQLYIIEEEEKEEEKEEEEGTIIEETVQAIMEEKIEGMPEEGQYEVACQQDAFDTLMSLPPRVSHEKFGSIWSASDSGWGEFIQNYQLTCCGLGILIGWMTYQQYQGLPDNLRSIIKSNKSQIRHIIERRGLTVENMRKMGEVKFSLIVNETAVAYHLLDCGASFADIIDLDFIKLKILIDNYQMVHFITKTRVSFKEITELNESQMTLLLGNLNCVHIFLESDVPFGSISELAEWQLNMINNSVLANVMLMVEHVHFNDIKNMKDSQLDLLLEQPQRVVDLMNYNIPFNDIMAIEKRQLLAMLELRVGVLGIMKNYVPQDGYSNKDRFKVITKHFCDRKIRSLLENPRALQKLYEEFESYEKIACLDQTEFDTCASIQYRDDGEYYNGRGLALSRLGKHKDAIEAYKEATKFDPYCANFYGNLGMALHESGDYLMAIEAYKEATKFDPDCANFYGKLGIALYKSGDCAGAIAEYTAAIQLQPNFAGYHNNLGLAYYHSGDHAEAVAAYKAAIYLNSDIGGYHYNLGNALYKNGDCAGAIAEYTAAIQLAPNVARYHCNLGFAYNHSGDYAEAIAAYKAAIVLNSEHAIYHYNLGIAYYDSGYYEEAIEASKAAIELEPNNVMYKEICDLAISKEVEHRKQMLSELPFYNFDNDITHVFFNQSKLRNVVEVGGEIFQSDKVEGDIRSHRMNCPLV